jgi:hypothetical protein
MASLPSPSSLTLTSFKVALDLYPSIVEKVYKSKLKDAKKIDEALKRDRWRFEELPASIAAIKKGKPDKVRKVTSEDHLSKETVEKLV